MRVNVITAFPYSPNGYEVKQAAVGVQDLPEDIAAIAFKEGWGTPAEAVKPAAATSADAPREALLLFTREKTIDEVREALQTVETEDALLTIIEGEQAHPDYPGGRKGVLELIDARAEQLQQAQD